MKPIIGCLSAFESLHESSSSTQGQEKRLPAWKAPEMPTTFSMTAPADAFTSPAAKASSVFFNKPIPTITSRLPRFRQRRALVLHYSCLNSVASISRFHTAALRKQRCGCTKHSHEKDINLSYVRDSANSFAAAFLSAAAVGIPPFLLDRCCRGRC